MPPVSLICPCTFGTVPLDHYSSGKCGGWKQGMKMPLEWVISIIEDRLGDAYHAGGRLTTTRCLTCPRETLIADLKPYALDPAKANSPHWGTAIHEKISRNRNSQYFEVCFGGPGDALPPARLFEEIGGIEICGRVDKITVGYGEIHDYKCHSETSQRYQAGDLDMTTAAQLNIYRLAIEQLVTEAKGKIETMIAYHGAMTSARGPEPWIPSVLPFLTESQILDIMPHVNTKKHETGATVREIIQDYQAFFARQADGMPLDENLGRVPLRGRKMFGGQKCTAYCQPGVRAICDGLEGL
jgi:hypothetical protein